MLVVRCDFFEMSNMDALCCSVCYRVVLGRNIRIYGRNTINRMICGEPSAVAYSKMEKKIVECKTNELIGQENGKWDYLYLD